MDDKTKEYVDLQLRWSRRLVDYALDDADFRSRLLANPKEAIAQKLGAPVPEPIEVRVVQQHDRLLYVVLPHIPEAEDEADDADFQEVTGGLSTPPGSWFCVPIPEDPPPAI